MPQIKNELPDIVIRRSGIWNSRAPFHNYLLRHREIIRHHYALVLAIYQLRYDAGKDNPNRHGRKFLKNITVEGGKAGGRAWRSYQLSFGRDSEGNARYPTVRELSNDLRKAIYDVREASIIKYASLFESFAQCWALNFLLSRLENGTGWTADERKLAQNFSPVHGKYNAPGWPIITQRIPDLRSGLSNLPHINKDHSTGADVTMPLSPELNAFRTIKFWRDLRNIAVHSSGTITSTFLTENEAFFEQLRKPFAAFMPPLLLGQRLKIFNTLLPSMAATHYKAALWMNNWLETESGQTRGHPQAPSPKTTNYFNDPIAAPPLLIPSDHLHSYQWMSDSTFRAKYL